MLDMRKFVRIGAFLVILAPLTAQAKWADTFQKHDTAVLVASPDMQQVPTPQPGRPSDRHSNNIMRLEIVSSAPQAQRYAAQN
jgi:hypothetical protein